MMGDKSSKDSPNPVKRNLGKSVDDSSDAKESAKRSAFDVDDGRHAKNLYDDAESPKAGWDDLARKVVKRALDIAAVDENHDCGSIYVGQCGISMAIYYLLGSRDWNDGSSSSSGSATKNTSENTADTKRNTTTAAGSSSSSNHSALIDIALRHCARSSAKVSPRRLTFLEGRSGVLALWAVLNHLAKREKQRDQGVHEVLALSAVVRKLPRGECELLYGRVGYVYSILFLQRALNNPELGAKEAESIVRQVIEAGLKSGGGIRNNFPLRYKWHRKCYLGAVHGLCGIYKILMHFPKILESMGVRDKLKKSIDKLLAMEFPSHNMPSSLESKKDRLVHFCHGATGFVSMCIMAAEFFKDPSYLDRAKTFGEVLWKRGLLEKKALGLCHGAPGNGMMFLSLYRKTGDALWLRRAQHFAVHVVHNFDRLAPNTDDPYSMFTGMLGAVVFLAGTLDPERSYFVGYELPKVMKKFSGQ
mmetsp:Transcript_6430/g.12081  ORF Transcript_6430/g.12081 Transcript_6430/m.12081 type:complete len:474 (-) Transcript_6430:216-1637(-)